MCWVNSFEEAKSDPAYWGRVFESACGAFLVNECRKNNYKLFYWREGNDEVDFVIQNGERIIAIEIKSGMRITHAGLSALNKRFKPEKSLIIGYTGIDVVDFLSMDISSLFK